MTMTMMMPVLSGQLGDRSLAPVGSHCIIELYDCPAHLLNDAAYIQQALRDAAEVASATLMGELAHQFEPQGVTALALLAESHISIHTWPENGYAAADVFTCGDHTKPAVAGQYLVKAFQAGRHLLYELPRRTMPYDRPTFSEQPNWNVPDWAVLPEHQLEEVNPCLDRKLAQISG